jgi:hypothetical protein
LNGNKSTLVEKQNKVIDEYLAVVSSTCTCMNTLSLPKLEGHVTHSLTQCGDIKEEEMSDAQLQERLDTLNMEKELLMECIKSEEVKLLFNHYSSYIGAVRGTGTCTVAPVPQNVTSD